MPVRLIVSFSAEPGKAAELAQAMKARCATSAEDAGCRQFEVFQSVIDPQHSRMTHVGAIERGEPAPAFARARDRIGRRQMP